MLLLLTVVNVSAAERQFYFMGKYERLGSLSSDAKEHKGVYLRWDIIEGTLPKEIKLIELIRVSNDGNKTLLNVEANASMPSTDIAQMYQEQGSQRRLFEIVNSISRNTNVNCTGANISNIGDKVRSCLQDNYWSFLASRVDFNVARARYRAYLDLDVSPEMGKVHYVLLAKDGENTLVLGDTFVELKEKSILPAEQFRQIISSQCNDGRYGLDDYRMALKWKNGGDRTDSFINNLMVSGYDLYYSTKTVEALGSNFSKMDIAHEASKLPHNAKGEVDLSSLNLKKANDTLITLGAEGNKPTYVERMKTLKERGFKPGEQRYYFLVPRDFTGNYGPTVSFIVTIPDLLPPPMPFNPRAVEEAGKTTLMWEEITPSSYANHYEDVMKPCATPILNNTNRIQFVELDESCQEGKGLMVNFNVKKYYVYRFESIKEAASFSDSDLDGYSDVNESAKGTQCNANRHDPLDQDLNHLVATIDAQSSKVVRFHDKDVHESKVYWYRIASATDNNVSSPLTAPIRAFVPHREVLDAPKFSVKSLGFAVKVVKNGELPSMVAVDNTIVAEDNTTEKLITAVSIEYKNEQYNFVKNSNFFNITDDFKRNIKFDAMTDHLTMVFYSDDSVIKRYGFEVKDLFTTSPNYAEDKENIVSYSIKSAHDRLVLENKVSTLVDGGMVENHCVTITYDDDYYEALTQRKGCIETTVRIGLNRYRKSTNCSPSKEQDICTEQARRGDLLSYRMIESLPSGITSQPTFLNVILMDADKVPNKPTLVSLNVSPEDNKATVRFSPQLENVKGTMLYLYKEGDANNTYTKIIPHIGNKKVEIKKVSIDSLVGVAENTTWCLKAKTIGLNEKVSDWSAVLCQDMVAEDALPERNLAWPVIQDKTEKRANLPIAFSRGHIEIILNGEDLGKGVPCGDFKNKLNQMGSFVVYRQRVDGEDSSNFVQVSPLIDGSGECGDNTIKEEFLRKERLSGTMSNNLYFEPNSVLKFIDRYPYVSGERYRYVVLFFDKESKEISAYALTDTITTE